MSLPTRQVPSPSLQRQMRFQNQEKGLFTFYKEQQLYDEQLENLKQQGPCPSPVQRKTKPSLGKAHSSHRYDGRQPQRQEGAEQKGVRFRYFGDAVMVVNRRQIEHADLNSTKKNSPSRAKESGAYLQNNNIDFDANYQEERKHSGRPQKSPSPSYSYNPSHNHNCKPLQSLPGRWETTKLPSIARIEQSQAVRSQTELKYKTGSMIRSNGNELLRHIRNRAEGSQGNMDGTEDEERLERRAVSYFEFSKDYESELRSRKKQVLSGEQRKLLEILGRYRRCDV